MHRGIGQIRRGVLGAALAAVLAALLAACGGGTGATVPGVAGVLVLGEADRAEPDAGAEDVEALVDANNAFALDLYGSLRGAEGNLFLSPLSISEALSMALAGAAGETAEQMRDTLRLELAPDDTHRAWNALDQALPREGGAEGGGADRKRFTLEIANALWPQAGLPLREAFLDTLARNYGAGVRPLDFRGAPEPSRMEINAWVKEATRGRIAELLGRGAIDPATRLVLTNTIYFNGKWVHPFEGGARGRSFHTLDEKLVEARGMYRRGPVRYGEGEGYQAVELPYAGGAYSMVIVLPRRGQFDEVESRLSPEFLDRVIEGIQPYEEGDVEIPAFRFRSEFSLGRTLGRLGMSDAFGRAADFSGMTPAGGLRIGDVVHEATVSVTKRGTEATAATAVIMLLSAPAVSFYADRPFLFLIRDRETGSILFLGRLLRP